MLASLPEAPLFWQRFLIFYIPDFFGISRIIKIFCFCPICFLLRRNFISIILFYRYLKYLSSIFGLLITLNKIFLFEIPVILFTSFFVLDFVSLLTKKKYFFTAC